MNSIIWDLSERVDFISSMFSALHILAIIVHKGDLVFFVLTTEAFAPNSRRSKSMQAVEKT